MLPWEYWLPNRYETEDDEGLVLTPSTSSYLHIWTTVHLRGYCHVARVPEGQTKHLGDFGDPFLLHLAMKTPARMSLVCKNCSEVINISNEIQMALISC